MDARRYYNVGSVIAVIGVLLSVLVILSVLPVTATTVGALLLMGFVARLT